MHAPTFTAVVVLPTPPFWFATAYTEPIAVDASAARGQTRGDARALSARRCALAQVPPAGVCWPRPPGAGTGTEWGSPSCTGEGGGLARPQMVRSYGSPHGACRAAPPRAPPAPPPGPSACHANRRASPRGAEGEPHTPPRPPAQPGRGPARRHCCPRRRATPPPERTQLA